MIADDSKAEQPIAEQSGAEIPGAQQVAAPEPSTAEDPTPFAGDGEDRTGLTAVQLRAIELTAQGWTDTRVAEELQVDRKTLWRWRNHDAAYRALLAEARVQVFQAATDCYQNILLKATAVLAQSLNDEKESTRFRAASTLLNMAGCFRPAIPKAGAAADSVIREPELPYKVG